MASPEWLEMPVSLVDRRINRTVDAGTTKHDTWATQDDGGDEGTRTPDPCDANAVLFQLSYIPMGRALAEGGRTGGRV